MGKLALRKPEVPVSVIPIFRYDHTQIPNYFLEKIVRLTTSAGEIKVCLYLFRLLQFLETEEIEITFGEIGKETNLTAHGVANSINLAVEHGILQKTSLLKKNGSNGPSYKFKFIKIVDYQNL